MFDTKDGNVNNKNDGLERLEALKQKLIIPDEVLNSLHVELDKKFPKEVFNGIPF